MSYDLNAHRSAVRTWYAELASKPGWADYAKGEARRLAHEDPTLHPDLVAAVQAAIPAPARATPTNRRT